MGGGGLRDTLEVGKSDVRKRATFTAKLDQS